MASQVKLTDGRYADLMILADSAGTLAGAPNATAANGIVPVVTAAVASSKVLKATPGNFYGCNAVAGASALYIMLIDATAAPADGAVTPIKCWTVAANASLEIGYATPIVCAVGITLVASTTGPFTKTASATAFLSGEAV